MNKISIRAAVISVLLSLAGTGVAHAATAPSLGDAESFSALAALSASSANTTTLSGDVGLSTGVSTSFTGPWIVGGNSYFGPSTLAFDARADALIAYGDLTTQPSDGVWSTDPVGGINAPEPGVWTETGSPAYTGTLTLTGSPADVWVFQISTDFTFSGDVVFAGGAQACNVFWAVAGDTTIAGSSSFAGTLISGNDITVVSGATVDGRVLSLDGDLTVDANTITNTACVVPTPVPAPGGGGGGGGSFLPPLIDVLKVPSPLSLANPGPVTYTFTVRNIGVVPMTDITLVDDTCTPIILVSGDANADATLQVGETWTYTCSATLTATHTNTVSATGWANGISATDIASAIVVVGGPVPPLIHVTKVPSPLALPEGGGFVTYTERVTNPGTVPLANVTLRDDRCTPLTFVSGDVDGDQLLDISETWTYTCRTNLTATTTNTAVVTGEANGVTVTDFAIATVIVGGILGGPGLPTAGLAPSGYSVSWSLVIAGLLLVAAATVAVSVRKRTI